MHGSHGLKRSSFVLKIETKINSKNWTKTIKTPSVGLTLILSICAKCYDSVFKSTLLRQSHTTRHNHGRGSIPQKEKQRKKVYCLRLVQLFFSAKCGVLLLGCLSLQGGFRFVRQRRQVYLDSMTHGLKTNGRKTINNREGFYGFW